MFSEYLKKIRIKNGRTQQELAEFLNISTQSISKWEQGKALPSIEFLPKIAEFFKCDINTFFYEDAKCPFENLKNIIKKEDKKLKISISHDIDGELVPINNDITEKEIKREKLMFPDLYELLKRESEISISKLQKRLSIGYYKARRILSALVYLGIVSSPSDGFFDRNIIKEKVEENALILCGEEEFSQEIK